MLFYINGSGNHTAKISVSSRPLDFGEGGLGERMIDSADGLVEPDVEPESKQPKEAFNAIKIYHI